VARTVAEVEQLRPLWSELPSADIDADIDYFLTVVEHSPNVVHPYVIVIQRADRPVLVVVARLESLPVAIRFGYRTVARPKLTAIVASFDGLVGIANRADAELVMSELLRALESGDADVVVLPKLDVDAPIHEVAKQLLPWLRRDHASSPVGRWRVELPDTIDAYLANRSAKARQQLRYYDRKLRKKYADDVEIRRFDKPEDFASLCTDLDSVACKTYQYRLGAGVTRDPVQRALMEAGLRHGWFTAWVLYLKGVPVSFWTGTRHGATFATGTPGFDPSFANERVGTFTMMRMIEDLCGDSTVAAIDLGHGDADYKRTTGATPRDQVDLLLYAGRPRAVAVNLTLTAAERTSQLAKRALARSSLGHRLKRAWRKKLENRGSNEKPAESA
jgi:CelD/BcsL family acetyltransferase involved in cellulose biosynthesis